jgi:ribosomal protein S18 acetylase RimI-like enzyme
VWALLEPVFRAGESFPHNPAITQEQAQVAWVEHSQVVMVAVDGTAGIRCWQRNGFRVVGTLPGAFRHRQLGYVDALVMVQTLAAGAKP